MHLKDLSIERNRDMPISWDFDIQQERKYAAQRAIYATLNDRRTQRDWTKDEAISYGATYLQYTKEFVEADYNTSYVTFDRNTSTTARKHVMTINESLDALTAGDYEGMKALLQKCADEWESWAANEHALKQLYHDYAKVLEAVVSVMPDCGEIVVIPHVESWNDERFQARRNKENQYSVFEVIYQREKDNS